MEYYLILTVLILGAVVTFGMYLTITTVANKIFEKQRWDMRSKNIEITLPLRLQAYERMSLFLERISPNNLPPDECRCPSKPAAEGREANQVAFLNFSGLPSLGQCDRNGSSRRISETL